MANMEANNKRFLDVAALKQLVAEIKKADTAVDTGIKNLIGFTPSETTSTVIGYVDALNKAEADRAKAAEKANADAIALLNNADTVEGSVAYAVKAEETRALAAEVVLQNAIDTEGARVDSIIGELGKVSAEEGAADHTVKSFVEAKIATVKGDATALEARVKANEDALAIVNGEDTVEGSIKKAQADAVAHADELDEAMDARVDKLEALHATKTVGEGDAAKEVFQTVAEEVATGIANLRDGADAAFDTLKEIANWINNSDTAAQGFDAAKRIVDLENEMGIVQGVGEGSITKAVADAQETLQDNIDAEAVAARAAEKANKDAIDALDVYVGKASVPAGSDPEANPGSAATGLTAKVEANAKAIADEETRAKGVEDAQDGRIAALETAVGEGGSVEAQITAAINELDAVATSVEDAPVTVKVTEVDGKITKVEVTNNMTPYTAEEITALFA